MPSLLVIVEECFAAGSKVMVMPRLKLEQATREPFAIKLRLPNGTERDGTAVLDFAHISGPLPPFAMVRLIGLTPDDVPAGTEIWNAE